MTYDILIMHSVERTRKAFHKDIRALELEQYFQKIRKQKMKDLKESEYMESQIIEQFFSSFPKHIEKVSLYHISGDVLTRLTEMPHTWLENCHKKLNMCEWASLVLLFINIFQKVTNIKTRLTLLQSAKDIICSQFKALIIQNKIMKRHLLTIMLDFYLEINQDITSIAPQYLFTLKTLLSELFLTKFNEYQSQIIKAVAICNYVINSNRQELELIMGEFFYNQKWVIFKMLTFIESYGLIYKNQKTNVLLQMMLIFLINLTEHAKTAKFYQLFLRSQFLAVIQSILSYPNDLQPLLLKLYLKLIFNLIISSHNFSIFVRKVINFNDLHAKISSEQEERLLNEIQEMLIQESLQ